MHDVPQMLVRGRALLQALCLPDEEQAAGPESCVVADGLESAVHRIMVITLNRQEQRRAAFLAQLQRFPSLCERVEWVRAVDGRALDLSQPAHFDGVVTAEGLEDARVPRERVVGYVLTRGAIGLALSLYRALGLIAHEEDEGHVFLLCEDDAVLCPDFPAEFARLRAQVEAHDPWWEVIHVGYNLTCTSIAPCGLASCMSSHRPCCVGVPDGLFGMYGMALPPRGARALLQQLFPVSLQVDTELSRLYQHKERVTGDTQHRATSTRPRQGARLRAFAPRAPSIHGQMHPSQEPGMEECCMQWTGPLVVAPASAAHCTDIQVLSRKNFEHQYGSL